MIDAKDFIKRIKARTNNKNSVFYNPSFRHLLDEVYETMLTGELEKLHELHRSTTEPHEQDAVPILEPGSSSNVSRCKCGGTCVCKSH